MVANLDDPVELSVTIPLQPGIRQELWLALQNHDELSFRVGSFQAEWFPCTDRSTVDQYVEAVSGFLSGTLRILEHYRGSNCVKAELQRPCPDEGWQTEATWSTLAWPSLTRKTYRVVRNG